MSVIAGAWSDGLSATFSFMFLPTCLYLSKRRVRIIEQHMKLLNCKTEQSLNLSHWFRVRSTYRHWIQAVYRERAHISCIVGLMVGRLSHVNVTVMCTLNTRSQLHHAKAIGLLGHAFTIRRLEWYLQWTICTRGTLVYIEEKGIWQILELATNIWILRST